MLEDDGGYLPPEEHQARLTRRRIAIREKNACDKTRLAIKAAVWGEPELWRDEMYDDKFDVNGNVRRDWDPIAWATERALIFKAAYGRPASFTRSGK